ncbi:3beta-hydroxysteroid-dehydrogenase/decarboxylase-like [Arachis duranensis]|uniref:3beta-hydroxysteroid- dehydrogenase/decarboxylase-like n=1 Tax=Arachis duranensis TaxID=130453 RepID=A0A6P5N1F7_ARADU|nr:3beta-hydroxysteroid-dehydrogenase/decarboxylase-like [Arachis duranensis]
MVPIYTKINKELIQIYYIVNSYGNANSVVLEVQGAKNVISAGRECKVKRLIYNSSVDVVFDGFHDIYNGDESLPYPCKGLEKRRRPAAEATVVAVIVQALRVREASSLFAVVVIERDVVTGSREAMHHHRDSEDREQ